MNKRELFIPAAFLALFITSGCAANNGAGDKAAALPPPAAAGAGSSFAKHLYGDLIPVFKQSTGVTIGYEAVGSTAGVKALINLEVAFAGTDVPLNQEQMSLAKGGEVVHVPTALGAVAVSYNLPGLNNLKLTPDVLSEIYLGRITRWNDPRLVALNPALASVGQDIIVVYRGDGSGTSFAFTDYLSKVNGTWRDSVGASSTANWPVGIDAEGNGGVADSIKQNPYSLGYLELGAALKEKLPVAALRNSAGNFVAPSLDSVSSAAAEIAQFAPADLRFSLANAGGSGSYPISTATWAAVYRNQSNCPQALAVSRFLWFTIHEGQARAPKLNYAPLPQSLVTRSEAAIRSITCKGQPVLP